MNKILLISTVIAFLGLNCYTPAVLPTAPAIEPIPPKLIVTNVGVDSIYTLTFSSQSDPGLRHWPPTQSATNVNQYALRLYGHDDSSALSESSQFTILCYFDDKSVQLFPCKTEDFTILSDNEFSVPFSLTMEKDGFVGFSIAMNKDMGDKDQSDYHKYFDANIRIFLRGLEQ